MNSFSPQRYVDLNALSETQKGLIWRGIQVLDPLWAKTIKEQRLKAKKENRAFVIPNYFTANDVNKYTEAGQKTIENN